MNNKLTHSVTGHLSNEKPYNQHVTELFVSVLDKIT